MSLYALKFMVKEHIKAALGLFCVYRLSKKPIFIFANRRGGSTLLMRMIYSQPGVDYIGEPLDFYNYHPHRSRLPQPSRNRLVSLDASDEKLFLEYWKDLLAGHYKLKHQWNIFDPDYNFCVDRLVVKEVYSNTLMDWFSEHFDIDVIYLIRHPIPVALSTKDLRWGHKASSFLDSAYFRNSFLDGDKEKYCRDILANGDILQQYVLEWCLENLLPLRVCRERPWLTLTYEELVLRPQEVSRLLCSRFDLPDPERMYKTLLRPTSTARGASKSDIRSAGPGHRSGSWVTQVDAQVIEAVNGLLEFFGIKAYVAHSSSPADELCHFGSLRGGE